MKRAVGILIVFITFATTAAVFPEIAPALPISIRVPRSLITEESMSAVFKKLNLKDQTEILILNAPSSFESELAALKNVTILRSEHKAREIAFSLAFVTQQKEIDTLAKTIARKAIGDAVVWFAYPKGHIEAIQKCDQHVHKLDTSGRSRL